MNDSLKLDSVPMAQWWDECHSVDDTHYLTGSKGSSVWNSLHIADRLTHGTKVLNIGVGLGQCTRSLCELGCVVDVLDISPVALERVADVVRAAWLPSQFEDMPIAYYDVVISHLVTQHMMPDDLNGQLSCVMRSLNSTGVFAMQFASKLSGEGGTLKLQREAKEGGVCWTLGEMSIMVENCGGRIVWDELLSSYPTHGSCWYGIHVIKA